MKNETKPKSRKKLVTIVIFLIIFGILVYWFGGQAYDWWKIRKEYARMGLAEDKFPYRLYTEEELREQGIFPDDLYSNIPTRTRPEETYKKFRKALSKGDTDKASEYFVEEYRDDWREALKNIKEKGLIQEMLNDLPEKIEDVSIVGVTTSYKDSNNEIYFLKDRYGDWKIESL